MAVKISAIVSAYYAEKYIQRRIDNLLNQTLPPEIIVICQDGSCEQKIASDYDVVIIATDDIPALPVAWNMGIKKAKGKYLTTANSDDLFHLETLQKLTEITDENKASVVFGDVDMSREGEKPTSWKRITEKRGIVENQFGKLSVRCTVGPMPIWRRDLHKRYGYFDESLTIVCDWDWWLRLAHGSEPFYYHPHSTGIYLMRSDSLERRDRALLKSEKKKVKEKWHV